MKFTIYLITTSGKYNYMMRRVNTDMAVSNGSLESTWRHKQIKVDFNPDTSLHVFKWKLIWDSDAPTNTKEGEEISYIARKVNRPSTTSPLPTGSAVMLWLEQVSDSLEVSHASAQKSLRELGLRQGDHLIIAPSLMIAD